MKRGLALLIALAAQLAGRAWATDEGWSFSLTPHLWLPNINGTLKYSGPQGGSQVFPQSGSLSERQDLRDALVGVRGRLKLGAGGWFAPYYLDAGAGSSALTLQSFAGPALGATFRF